MSDLVWLGAGNLNGLSVDCSEIKHSVQNSRAANCTIRQNRVNNHFAQNQYRK